MSLPSYHMPYRTLVYLEYISTEWFFHPFSVQLRLRFFYSLRFLLPNLRQVLTLLRVGVLMLLRDWHTDICPISFQSLLSSVGCSCGSFYYPASCTTSTLLMQPQGQILLYPSTLGPHCAHTCYIANNHVWLSTASSIYSAVDLMPISLQPSGHIYILALSIQAPIDTVMDIFQTVCPANLGHTIMLQVFKILSKPGWGPVDILEPAQS